SLFFRPHPPRSPLFPYTTLFRSPHLEDLALDAQLIPGSHGSWPAELVSPGAHDAASGFEVALDQEPHGDRGRVPTTGGQPSEDRSEEHTSELQSLRHLVCRLLLE